MTTIERAVAGATVARGPAPRTGDGTDVGHHGGPARAVPSVPTDAGTRNVGVSHG